MVQLLKTYNTTNMTDKVKQTPVTLLDTELKYISKDTASSQTSQTLWSLSGQKENGAPHAPPAERFLMHVFDFKKRREPLIY